MPETPRLRGKKSDNLGGEEVQTAPGHLGEGARIGIQNMHERCLARLERARGAMGKLFHDKVKKQRADREWTVRELANAHLEVKKKELEAE